VIDVDAVRRRFALAACVTEHSHHGTHDGEERGLVCKKCHDGVMGHHSPRPGALVFAG
jgi:hypothetical protein